MCLGIRTCPTSSITRAIDPLYCTTDLASGALGCLIHWTSSRKGEPVQERPVPQSTLHDLAGKEESLVD